MVIDRFENNFAICEDDFGTFIQIPKSELPKNVKEGDILKKNSNGIWETDEKEKAAILEDNSKRLAALLNRNSNKKN